ncbi:hypothetical protein JN06_02262 [Bacteroides zoogleoformans]|uniref:hypothetical protein n=1 Tax=Bacteroides zoogleoformans TaxID=28119 RepID=UPI0011AC2760|nr:hypothetical protein [Bacteroides zoogleoformans]TWJ11299.1 hypothetical protein JN06_02262 [Bacteroides zoogleoformans]
MIKLFFELIKVSLGNREGLDKAPSVAEWEVLYDFATKQSLQGVLTQIRCLQADFQIFLDFLGRQAGNLLACFSRHDYKCLRAAFKMYGQQNVRED